jgi:hypothetical protein
VPLWYPCWQSLCVSRLFHSKKVIHPKEFQLPCTYIQPLIDMRWSQMKTTTEFSKYHSIDSLHHADIYLLPSKSANTLYDWCLVWNWDLLVYKFYSMDLVQTFNLGFLLVGPLNPLWQILVAWNKTLVCKINQQVVKFQCWGKLTAIIVQLCIHTTPCWISTWSTDYLHPIQPAFSYYITVYSGFHKATSASCT